MEKVWCALLFLVSVNRIHSQASILGYNNPHLTQSVVANPAFIPQFGVSVGFGTSVGLYYPHFNLGDFFSRSTGIKQGLDSFLARPWKQLKDIEIENRINLLNIGIRSRRAYLSMNTAIVTKLSVHIDKDLLGFVYYGNDESSPYFGKRMDLDFSRNQGTVIWENRLTYARSINKWLNMGLILTNYTGLYRYDIKSANFGIYSDTSVDHIYKIKADGNWNVQTNGIRNLNPLLPMDFVGAGPFINSGASSGFGIMMKPMRKIKVAGSINNFGSISWGYKTYNHNLVSAAWYFEGLDSTSLAKGNGAAVLSNLNDSVSKYFNYDAEIDLRWYYNIAFNPNYYFGIEYLITPQNRFSFQYGSGNGVKQNQAFWALQSQNRLREHLDLMVSYAKYDLDNKQSLLGLGFSAYFKHYQIYLMANNVRGLIQLDKSHYHSLDLGLNFIFTENIDTDGDNVPDHRDNCKEVYGNIRYRGCPDFISSTPYLYDPNYRKLKKMEDNDDRFEGDKRRNRRNHWYF